MKKALLFLAGLTMATSAFAGADKLYGIGQIDDWGNFGGPTLGKELEKTADGVFTWSGTIEKTAYFAFTAELGTWDAINANRYAPATKDAPAVVGDNTMVAGVDASWKINPGKYTFTIDTNEMVLKVVENGSVEQVITYVIHGQLDGLTDTDWKDYELKAENDDLWTATITPTVSGGEFGVQQKVNGGNSDWYAAGVSFDAANTTFALTGEPAGNCTFDGTANKEYKFSFVPSTKTLTVTEVTSVDTIGIDNNAPAEYYNLQGVRVSNPEKGLYIVRQGDKVSKQVIR